MKSERIRTMNDALTLAEYVVDTICNVQFTNELKEKDEKYGMNLFIGMYEKDKARDINNLSDRFFERIDKHVNKPYVTLVMAILHKVGFPSTAVFYGDTCVEVTFEGYFTIKR